MIQPITLLGVALLCVVLYLKYKNRPKGQPPASGLQRLLTLKALLFAVAAWIALHYTLQHLLAQFGAAPFPK
jgi:hypothetical protein